MNRLNFNQKYSCHWISLIKFIALFFVLINAFVGVIWIIRNISDIPLYGDTEEYLVLSKSLVVDQYRGILYPYILNRSNYIAETIGLKLQHAVYFVQILLTFFSAQLLAFSILPNTIRKRGRLLISLITATVVLFDPLVAHFALTILTDSLATSFTMMYLSFLIFALNEKNNQTLYIAMSACIFILMSLIRVDKFYFGLIIYLLFVLLLCVALWYKKSNSRGKVSIIFSMCCIFIAIASVSLIKTETQISNPNRPPLDISSLAFNRVVWPRMSNVYEHFPAKIKERITKAEAEKFDEHNNNVYPFLTKTLQEKDGKEIISSITLITLKHFPLQVAAKTAFDFAKYTLPNLAFPLEIVGGLPTSAATDWTVSRMGMFQPRLTKIFLLLGMFSFFSMLVYISKKIFLNDKKRFLDRVEIANSAIIIFLAIVTNSTLFSLEAGMDTHIRYALPSYTIILTGLVSLFFRGILREK